MNYELLAGIIERKGKLFIGAKDLPEMGDESAAKEYAELSAFLIKNKLELVQKSIAMFVIQKVPLLF